MPRVVVPDLSEWLGIERDHPTRRWPALLPDMHLAADRRDLAQAVSPGDRFAFLFPASIWCSEDGSLVETAGEPSGCTRPPSEPMATHCLSPTEIEPFVSGMPRQESRQVISSGIRKLSGQPRLLRTAGLPSPPGKTGSSGTLDPVTGRVVGELLHHPVPVKRLWYEPRSKEFTTLGHDGIERRWDAETAEPRGIPVPHGRSVTKIALSPTGGLCSR